MQRLALYFDVGVKPWKPESEWKDLALDAWDKFFRPGISSEAEPSGGGPQTYVLPPVGGQLTYIRRGPNARSGDEEAIQEADVNLETVSLQLTSKETLFFPDHRT